MAYFIRFFFYPFLHSFKQYSFFCFFVCEDLCELLNPLTEHDWISVRITKRYNSALVTTSRKRVLYKLPPEISDTKLFSSICIRYLTFVFFSILCFFLLCFVISFLRHWSLCAFWLSLFCHFVWISGQKGLFTLYTVGTATGFPWVFFTSLSPFFYSTLRFCFIYLYISFSYSIC